VVVLAAGRLATAAPIGSPTARQAVALCQGSVAMEAEDAARTLDRGAELADEAVAADPTDPVAHFAVFCTRARRLEREGLSFGVVRQLGRLRRALDAAIALAPDWPDPVAAKGALLLRLPRLFGGDAAEGLRLLHRAATLDPDNRDVRALLADHPQQVADN